MENLEQPHGQPIGTEDVAKKNIWLINEFLEDLGIRAKSPYTIRVYKSRLLTFAKTLETSLEKIREEDLRKYIRQIREVKKQSEKTVNLDFSAIGALYDYLEYKDIVTNNLVPKFRKYYISPRTNRRLNNSGNGTKQLLSVNR